MRKGKGVFEAKKKAVEGVRTCGKVSKGPKNQRELRTPGMERRGGGDTDGFIWKGSTP